jgi:hypothetical protein
MTREESIERSLRGERTGESQEDEDEGQERREQRLSFPH